MPRIDQIQGNKKFIKKKYRSWDTDLLEKIKLPMQTELEGNQGSDHVNQGSIRVQLESKKEEINNLILNLNGLQKAVFFFVIQICHKRNCLSTGQISGKIFDSAISIKRNSRETSIKRLVNKRLITRNCGKPGLNGTINFKINKSIKQEAMRIFESKFFSLDTNIDWNVIDLTTNRNRVQIRVQDSSEKAEQLGFNSDPNSISINNNTTTDLTETGSWKKINIVPLEKIGFSGTQLKQLQSLNAPDVVQESIHHFAYGLQHNKKTKAYDAPLNVLMGVLRKGEAWVESQYEPAQVIAQRDLLARKQAEREKLKALHDQAYNLAFETWQSGLSDTEQTQHIDAMTKPPRDIRPQSVRLSCYFRERVWPTVQQDYLIAPSDSE